MSSFRPKRSHKSISKNQDRIRQRRKKKAMASRSSRKEPVGYDNLEARCLLATVFYQSPDQVVSMDNLIGDFSGVTFAQDASIVDTSAVPADPNNPDPPDYDGPVRAITDKLGNTLYPIDSAFGFYVEDFVGATEKVRDGIYDEGWIGNIVDAEGNIVGISIADAETDIFKSGSPLGTWAAGLGGNSVKASTEHYVVMQDILSDQLFPDDPNAVYQLDNNLVVVGGVNDGRFMSEVITEVQALYDGGDTSVDVFPFAAPGVPAGDGVIDIRDILTPNESTVTENIAVGNDYSVTLKDDGKLLYRWGQVVKRPNDIRLGVQVDLPAAWQSPDAALINGGKGYRIVGAELVMTHAITNNPNDQIRPEDFENEAATGRKPSYMVIEHPDHPGDSDYALWVATADDFKGDGTFLPSYFVLDDNGDLVLDGSGNPIVNTDDAGDPIGTIFREVTPDGAATSILTSSDLEFGFTDAWYTSMDRDPFEAVLDGNGDYVVGPRWRMKSNKFGQDLPGVEIPLIPHSEPPFQKDNIKYEVGELTTTTINLLDWVATEDSPLLYSNGWVYADPALVDSNGVTFNGLQLTDKFDVAVYIKGDAKATQLYSIKINLIYEAGTTFTVTTTADSGAGSLREVIEFANLTPGVDAIEFAIPGTGVQTITPLTALPDLTDAVVVDGTTQPGYTLTTPMIEINGASAGVADGLRIFAGDSTVEGLVINRFAGDGIELVGEGRNLITNNFLGVDATGTVDLGNLYFGVHVNQSSYNIIDSNLSSGNDHSGIALRGTGATENLVIENRVGTAINGTTKLANTYHGMLLVGGANHNYIGAADQGNLFSGNRGVGVLLSGADVTDNQVAGNLVGTTIDGMSGLGNGTFGIHLTSSPDNAIRDNVVSGNSLMGIVMRGTDTTNNRITENEIGVDETGLAVVANGVYGVQFLEGAHGNVVGGSQESDGNVISGNGHSGVSFDALANNNSVMGNLIGLDATGLSGLGNYYHGVVFNNGSYGNFIGGAGAGEGNVISSNGQVGVHASAGSHDNAIIGNRIGTDESGENGIGNAVYGINLVSSPSNVVTGNQIAASGLHGVTIRGVAAASNALTMNQIGRLASSDATSLANHMHGVLIADGAHDNQIGGDTEASGNVIAFNTNHGVVVAGNGVNNRIRFNSLYSNGGLGIDLGNNGVTANDAGDADSGPNRLQNTPQLVSANLTGSTLQVTYSVDTETVNADYPIVVDFYLADGAGQEGKTYLFSDIYTTVDHAAGSKQTSYIGDLNVGDNLLAIATDGNGLLNTSEFSAKLTVV